MQPTKHNTRWAVYFYKKREEILTHTVHLLILGVINTPCSYLTADYERGTFNVSACVWNEGAEENIVTISSKDSGYTSSSTPGGSSSLGGGAIAGIVIGAVVFALIVAALIVLLIRRHRKKAAYAVSPLGPDASVMTGPVHNAPPTPGPKYYSPETIGTSPSNAESNGGSGADRYSDRPETELDGNSQQVYQLHGESIPPQDRKVAPVYYELGGSEVRKTGSDRVSPVGTTPSTDQRERDNEPPSPFVSTLGTMGWQDEGGDASSDLVSPTTPVHRGKRGSMATEPSD